MAFLTTSEAAQIWAAPEIIRISSVYASKPMTTPDILKTTKIGTHVLLDGEEAIYLGHASIMPVFRWVDKAKKYAMALPCAHSSGGVPDNAKALGFNPSASEYTDTRHTNEIAFVRPNKDTKPGTHILTPDGKEAIFIQVSGECTICRYVNWKSGYFLDVSNPDSETNQLARSLGMDTEATDYGCVGSRDCCIIETSPASPSTQTTEATMQTSPSMKDVAPGTKAFYLGRDPKAKVTIIGSVVDGHLWFAFDDWQGCIGLPKQLKNNAKALGLDPDANYYGEANARGLESLIQEEPVQSKSSFGLLIGGMLLGGLMSAWCKPTASTRVSEQDHFQEDEQDETKEMTA